MGRMTGETEAAGQGSRDRRKQGRLHVQKEMQNGIRAERALGAKGFLRITAGEGQI